MSTATDISFAKSVSLRFTNYGLHRTVPQNIRTGKMDIAISSGLPRGEFYFDRTRMWFDQSRNANWLTASVLIVINLYVDGEGR